jgi:two-component system cell cycle sensor histidine kinase/response regulator CckA
VTTDPTSHLTTPAQFEQIAASLGGIVWECDARTFEFSFVTEQAERLLGYPRAQWLEPGFWQAHLHPDDRDWAVQFCVEATRQQRDHDLEYRMIASDGRVVWLRDIVSVLTVNGEADRLRGVMVDITEQRQRDEALRESVERLRLAAQASNVGLWDWDLRTNHVVFSPEWKRQLGYADDEIRSHVTEWEQRLHPDDAATTRAALEAYMAGDQPEYAVEFRMRHKDGSWRWIYARGEVQRDSAGRPTSMLGCHVDITERKRAEDERQAHLWFLESMDRVNRAIQSATDLDQMLFEALDAVLAVFGCDRAYLVYPCDPEADFWSAPMECARPEFPGLFTQGLKVPMESDIAEVFRLVLASSAPVRFGPAGEHPMPAGVATRFGVQSQIVMAVYPKVGKPYAFGLHQCSYLRAWTAGEERLFQEIGRRLADALSSLLIFRQLRESEHRLSEAQRLAHLGYWEHDLEADVVTWSDETYRIWGLTPGEPLDIPLLVSWIHPDDQRRVREGVEATRQGGPRHDIEYRIIRPDGDERVLLSQGDLALDAHRIFGTVQDITNLRRLEEQFRQAQKMEAVGRLAGGIAHDFNNLLTVITGYGELGFSMLGDGDPTREMLAEIQKAGERAANLTRQLLAFSRKQVLQPQVVSVATLLAELFKLLQRLIGEDVEMALVQGAAVGLTEIDPGQFEQAVINLAVNARDAMPHGGRLTIETHNRAFDERDASRYPDFRPGHYVVVAITDTGHGIDDATRLRIFEPFFTTKDVGKGTGLGLAMVYGFVKQSGGHVDVSSEPGKGTTFRLFLPHAERITTPEAASPEITRVPRGAETILLVEDEAAVRDLAKRVLQSCGYTVLEAADGQEALHVASEHAAPIHLLVTDLVMPRMGGRQLADTFQRIRPQTRVLYMSGYTDEAMLANDMVGTALLQKPFRPMTIARKVRDILDLART